MTSTKDKHSLKVLAFLIACIIWGWIQLNEEELNAIKYRLSCSELYHEGVYLMNVQFEHGNISSKLVITGD